MHNEVITLGGLLRAYRKQIVLGLSMVFGHVLIQVASPFLVRFAIDDLVAGVAQVSRLLQYAGLLIGAALLSGVCSLYMRKILLGTSYDIECEIRRRVFEHMTRLDHAFYSRERTGDLMTRMTSDLNAVREFLGQGLLQGARTGIGFVLAFSVMFSVNATMALYMMLILPCISLIFFSLLRLIRRRYEQSQEQFSIMSNFSQESFAGIRTLRGYALEERQTGFFALLNEDYIALKMALSRVERPLWPMMTLLFSSAVVMLLLTGGRRVMAGTLTLGSFVQFMQYLFMLQWPMLALGWTINLLQKGRTSWGRIRSILEATPAIRDTEATDQSVSTLSGAIDFEGVRLVLGGRPVLDGIDLHIAPGETIGVTGPTGAGKTVLVWLIARLLETTEGVVKVGGHDVRHVPLDVLRRAVGLAPQEAFLFSDTLANNIAFGITDNDLEKIYSAAEVAQLSPDVELFPDRYETLLGERGVTLSGGQRQRTAISRAIARNPVVLILDDVFSAIDTQTEANIQARLLPVLRDRTSLVISHRVSSLRHVDRIIVLSEGQIVQQGTHRELVMQPGYYRDLDEMQRLEARLETMP